MPNPQNLTHLDVLIVSEKPDHLRTIVGVVGASPARVSACFTVRQAQVIFARQCPDLVLCDEYLSDGSYRDLLLSTRFGQNSTAFILLLHKGEWEEYLTAMRLGVLDVLRCPLHRPEVEAAVRQAFERKERQIAELSAGVPPDSAAEWPAQDALFEDLLERAAATISPRGSGSNASDHRPTAVRRDVA